jgi:hypothetical protein
MGGNGWDKVMREGIRSGWEKMGSSWEGIYAELMGSSRQKRM